MKKSAVFISLLISIVFLHSCSSNFSSNSEGFKNAEKELISKFGADAYYTNISLLNNKTTIILSCQVTKDPSSLQMGDWYLNQGVWQQSTEITLEVSNGKPEDFMYKIQDVNLAKLGELVEKSIEQIKTEKKIDNIVLESASITAPRDGNMSEMTYYVSVKPKNGGTSFNFNYKLNGELYSLKY